MEVKCAQFEQCTHYSLISWTLSAWFGVNTDKWPNQSIQSQCVAWIYLGTDWKWISVDNSGFEETSIQISSNKYWIPCGSMFLYKGLFYKGDYTSFCYSWLTLWRIALNENNAAVRRSIKILNIAINRPEHNVSISFIFLTEHYRFSHCTNPWIYESLNIVVLTPHSKVYS